MDGSLLIWAISCSLCTVFNVIRGNEITAGLAAVVLITRPSSIGDADSTSSGSLVDLWGAAISTHLATVLHTSEALLVDLVGEPFALARISIGDCLSTARKHSDNSLCDCAVVAIAGVSCCVRSCCLACIAGGSLLLDALSCGVSAVVARLDR
eukprot:COSAG01_NODE_39392_length_477_cov_0.775132_1_plen_153_part_01